MIDFQPNYNTAYKWSSNGNIFAKGVAFDEKGSILSGKNLVSYFNNTYSIENFKQRLTNLNGMFVIVILRENSLWAAVDRLRTFPLLYHHDQNNLILSDDYRHLLSKISVEMDNNSILSMRSFGYVMGENTLIENVKQLEAGSLLIYGNDSLQVEQWHVFQKKAYNFTSRDEWKSGLKSQLEILGKNLIKIIGNRPVALPLSGGFDSRLIGYLLKTNNYKNVLCFTYGNPDYWEAKRSKEIANKLGFPWVFIDYKPFLSEDIFHNKEFLKYADYAGNAVSFPFLVEYFAARHFNEQYKLPENTVFLPGHSGDMIAGSHLFPDMKSFKSKRDVAIKILRKNGKQLYADRKTRAFNISLIEKNITPEVFNYSYLTHDNWNINQRQSKQIINCAKVWDYFGFEYYLPLWDNEFTDFCLSIPFEFRTNKNLYEETLFELFAENNLLSPHDKRFSSDEIKKILFKYHIKELFPFIENIKRNYDEKQGNDFFYHHLFLSSIKDNFHYLNYREGSAIMSEWYVKHVEEQIV